MKIITLHQPWASFVALGLKRYETRHWPTNYKGKLLIHAAQEKPGLLAKEVYLKANQLVYDATNTMLPRLYNMPFGEIVAIADLTACKPMKTVRGHRPEFLDAIRIDSLFIEDQSELEIAVGLWEPGRFAFRLDNVRPLLKPIPFKSRQGKLLDAPPEIIALVNEQFQEVA